MLNCTFMVPVTVLDKSAIKWDDTLLFFLRKVSFRWLIYQKSKKCWTLKILNT